MNNKTIRDQLNEYYATFKEADAIYNSLAKKCGLSDAALWVLYSIREAKDECTQKMIKEQWSMSKQTVNSAIRDLIKDDLIVLSESQSDKRSKQIKLTENGEKFAIENIDTIYRYECSAFERMTDKERTDLIVNSRKFLELLRLEISHHIK